MATTPAVAIGAQILSAIEAEHRPIRVAARRGWWRYRAPDRQLCTPGDVGGHLRRRRADEVDHLPLMSSMRQDERVGLQLVLLRCRDR